MLNTYYLSEVCSPGIVFLYAEQLFGLQFHQLILYNGVPDKEEWTHPQ